MEQDQWTNLVDDILFDIIISRLQLEDILRCRWVCRTWRSFIAKHLGDITRGFLPDSETRDYTESNGSRVYLYSFNACIENSIEPKKLEFTKFRSVIQRSLAGYERYLVGYSHWLACIMDCPSYNSIGKSYNIILWNPFLNKTMTVKKFNLRGQVVLGFGFVPQTSDYKVVKLESPSNCAYSFKVEVYSLLVDSWETISTTKKYTKLRGQCCQSPNAFVRGSAHWVVSTGPMDNQVILCFNMVEEELREIKMPYPTGARASKVTAFQDTLALAPDLGFYKFQLWVMKEYGIADSWSRVYTLEGWPFSYNCEILSNGDIILGNGHGTLICYDPSTRKSKEFRYGSSSEDKGICRFKGVGIKF